jgi:hypothetical protein
MMGAEARQAKRRQLLSHCAEAEIEVEIPYDGVIPAYTSIVPDAAGPVFGRTVHPYCIMLAAAARSTRHCF